MKRGILFAAALLAPCTVFALEAEEIKPRWVVETETSPIDDSKTVTMSLDAVADEGRGKREASAALIVRLKEGKLQAYYVIDDFISTDSTPVTTRWDEEKAETEDWDVSSNFKAVFHPDPAHVVEKLLKAEKLVIRLTPHGESPRTSTFASSDFVAKIGPLREALKAIRKPAPTVKASKPATPAPKKSIDPMTGKESALDRMKRDRR
jgi:type VI secretion system protein VasI